MRFTIKTILLITIWFMTEKGLSQNYSGRVFDKSGEIVEFANIGIINKDVGTVSNENGFYTLSIESMYDEDTIRFSCIGYIPYKIRVADYKALTNKNILLKKTVYEINEVIVRPFSSTQKTLGISTRSKLIATGFIDNKLG